MCLGRGRANNIALTTLVLTFREEEEEKEVREIPEVRGQVNVMSFRGREAWAGIGDCVFVENS